MCAQGVNCTTSKPLTICGNQNAEQLIVGWSNETVLGEKSETVTPAWGVGVLGLKTDIIVGMQLGMILGFKGEYTMGLKYDRVPYGEFHVVGDFSGAHASHSMTVGTSFFVNAGVYAQILSPTLILTASDPVLAVDAVPETPEILSPGGLVIQAFVPGIPAVAATTNATTLSLLATQALLTGGGNTTTNLHPANLALTQAGATLTGITQANLVSILAAALLINHTTSASLGISNGNSITANADGVTIIGLPAVMVNCNEFQVNAGQTALGQPAVTVATYAALLQAAEAAATAAATAAKDAAAEAVKAGAAPAPGTAH
jgi:hypothetical protein